jgi:pyruvate dehydrogenase E1 component
LTILGTDGYGRSESRAALRDFFEVDARHIAFAALSALVREKKVAADVVNKAIKLLEIKTERGNPLYS